MWFNWQKTTVCVHGKDVPQTHKNPVLEWFPNRTLSLINLLLSAFPSFTQSVKANYKRSGVCWGWDKMGKLPWWMQIEISQMHWISASQWASENPDLTACLVLKGLYYELNQSGQTSTMWRLMVCEFVPEDSKKSMWLEPLFAVWDLHQSSMDLLLQAQKSGVAWYKLSKNVQLSQNSLQDYLSLSQRAEVTAGWRQTSQMFLYNDQMTKWPIILWKLE